MTSDAAPPEGFAPHFRRARVTGPWGPLFSRRRDGAAQLGVRLSEAHCNSRGLGHGAVIARASATLRAG